MTLRLTDRLLRLLRADAHSLLSNLEEKGSLLREGLREAELAFQEKEIRLNALVEELRNLELECAALRSEEESRDKDVGLALARGELELARFAARSLLLLRREREQRERELAQGHGQREKLADSLVSERERLEQLRSRVKTRLARMSREDQLPTPEALVSDADVELELLRRRGAEETSHA